MDLIFFSLKAHECKGPFKVYSLLLVIMTKDMGEDRKTQYIRQSDHYHAVWSLKLTKNSDS